MEIKSISKKTEPEFAKWEAILLDRSLLKNNIPARWKTNHVVFFSLFAFLTTNTKIEAANNSDNSMKSDEIQRFTPLNLEIDNNKSFTASVAPVFIYGKGVGGGGCVSVAPAVFLSEGEALTIIEEEFKKEGIEFKRKNVVTDAKFKLARRDLLNEKDQVIKRLDSIETNAVMNLYNTELNIGISYFGSKNSDVFNDIIYHGGWSSAWSFDAKKAAMKSREIMEDYGKIIYGAFYDPVFRYDDLRMDKIVKEFYDKGIADESKYKTDKEYMFSINQKAQAESGIRMKEKSIELLKQQIHDFLEWYKNNSNN